MNHPMQSSTALQATNPPTPHHVSIRLLISARSPAVISVDNEYRIELRPRLESTTSSSLRGTGIPDPAAAGCCFFAVDTVRLCLGDETLGLRFGGIFGQSQIYGDVYSEAELRVDAFCNGLQLLWKRWNHREGWKLRLFLFLFESKLAMMSPRYHAQTKHGAPFCIVSQRAGRLTGFFNGSSISKRYELLYFVQVSSNKAQGRSFTIIAGC